MLPGVWHVLRLARIYLFGCVPWLPLQPHHITSMADAWATVGMEILAHISARTTKKDDDRFRAQAQAYVGFKPARRIDKKQELVCDGAHETGVLQSQGRKRPAEEVSNIRQQKVQIYQDPGIETPRARRSTAESLSSYCRWADGLGSAIGIRIRNAEQPVPKEIESARSPISSGTSKSSHSSSARTPLQRLEDVQTNWRSRRPKRSTNNVIWSPNEGPRNSKTAMPSDTQLEDTQVAATFLESQLQGAYSFSSVPTDDMNGNVDALETGDSSNELSFRTPPAGIQSLSELYRLNTADTTSQRSSSNIGSEEPRKSYTDRQRLIASGNQSTGSQPSSACEERGKRTTYKYSEPDSIHNYKPPVTLANLPQTIDSPQPTPKYLKLEGTGTSMTQTLQTVISQKDFSERYRPTAASREPSPFERGFWRIDTASWSAETQLEFWQFMQGFIGRGRAGIGTACTRNMLPDGTVDIGSHGRLGVVRIYCWGELVKPIFLLAYLGSKGFVRKVNPQWISAATSNVVIQMP